MIINNDKSINYIHYNDGSRRREITYVYYLGKRIWELIIGFLFTKDGYSLQTKDNYILKSKD